MSIISVNGHSQVPPGFRFHPTEEELLQYYLRKKVSNEKIDLDVIPDVDLNKLEPWDIQEKCKIGSTPQNDWYFFSHKDKKYPTGTRTNRATAAGFWKATGRDKVIYSNSRRIGMRKTLVFYKGRAPHGQKSDWIMHEYRLLDDMISNAAAAHDEYELLLSQEEGWVVCRIFKKKNHHHHHKTTLLVADDGSAAASCASVDVDVRSETTRGQIMAGNSALRASNINNHIHHDHEGTKLMEQILECLQAGRRSSTTTATTTTTSCMHLDEEDIIVGYDDEANPFKCTVFPKPKSSGSFLCCSDGKGGFMKLPSLSAENPKSCIHDDEQPMSWIMSSTSTNNSADAIHIQQLPKAQDDSSSDPHYYYSTSRDRADLHQYSQHMITGGTSGGLGNWAALDLLDAATDHLNGQTETSSATTTTYKQQRQRQRQQLASGFSNADAIADPTNRNSSSNTCSTVVGLCSPSADHQQDLQLIRPSSSVPPNMVNQQQEEQARDYQNECELWSFARSSLSFAAAPPHHHHDPAALGSHTPNVPV